VFFERNYKLLAETQNDVYKKLNEPAKVSLKHMDIGFAQNDKNEVDNIAIKIGEQIYLDSKGSDSEQWVQCINPAIYTIIVLGLGLGYHIEKIIEKHPDKKIIIIEPDKRILIHSMHMRDLEAIFSKSTLWVDEDVSLVNAKIYEMLTHPLARGMQFVPYIMLYGDYTSQLLMFIQKMLSDHTVMINTKRSLAYRWYENRIINIKRDSVNASNLMGKFKDIPGILVGAGPSLKTQLELLKLLNNKAVVIAASTAGEILHTHGIKPTFMIAIDQDPVSSGGLHEKLDSDVPLVYDGQVAHNSLDYKGRKFQIRLNVNHYSNIVFPDLPTIESGPSVANVGMDFLYKLGCSPILMCGVDLSYTNKVLYCDGTRFQEDKSKQENMLKLLNNKGEMCATEPSFLSMRNWFAEYAGRIKPNVFNCTETGLIIDNIPNKTFDDFDLSKEYPLDSIIDECYYKDGKPDFINLSNITETNNSLTEELNSVKDIFLAGQPIQPCKVWVLVEELSQAFIYLEEIMCEGRIKNGMDKKESIKIFQEKKREIILNNIEKLKKMFE
jgi:hypothetical protein